MPAVKLNVPVIAELLALDKLTVNTILPAVSSALALLIVTVGAASSSIIVPTPV